MPKSQLLCATLCHLLYCTRVMNERTWDGTYGHRGNASGVPHVDVPYDANDETSKEAIQHWVEYAGFYVWPQIQQFTSFDDLIGEACGRVWLEMERMVILWLKPYCYSLVILGG